MSMARYGRLRRGLRRLRRVLGWGVLGLVIVAALCVGLASQFLPLLTRHPEAVARWLSGQIGEPVALTAVEARWNRAGPQLSLSGLRIGAVPEVLDIDTAQLQVNVYSGLWPGVPLTELRLTAPELELHRAADGRWRLDGFGRRLEASASGSQFEQLRRFGAIDVVGAQLRFNDAVRGHRFELQRIDARLRRGQGRLHFGVLLHGRHGARLRLAGDVAEHGQDGTLYFEGLAQDWAAWTQGVSLHGIGLTRAHGDVRAWLDFSNGAPSGLQVETDLAPLVFRREDGNAAGDASMQDQTMHFAAWQLDARLLRQGADGWQLTLPRWRVQDAVARQPLDIVREGHAARDDAGLLRAQVDDVALGPLFDLVRLVPQLSAGLRGWVAGADPQGRMHAVRLLWAGADSYRFQAQVADIGWSPQAGVPALRGISGTLDGDARAVRFQVGSGVWDMRAPDMLRESLAPRVTGEILLFRDDDGARIETPGLRLHEDAYDILLGGGVAFPRGGGALLDLRADVAEAPIVVAKRFWPINRMPSAAVRWLDNALIDGRVAHGMALVRGNLRDWPFRHGEGRFEAQAELADAQLRYRGDWPVGHKVSGMVRFINTAMELDLHGEVAGVAVTAARGGVPDFGDAVLNLDVLAAGAGPALLDVLRQSPLRRTYGAYMRSLTLGGRGTVALALRIPLEAHLGTPRVDGQVDIDRMDMQDEAWGLDFDAASGRIRFSERGFSADELNVGFGGSLGALTIAVGDYTSAESHLVEASLRGRFPVDALTATHAGTRWLEPWMQGESDWTVQLTVPDPPENEPARPTLRIRSDLAGTAISLPAPLRKTAADRLPLDVRFGLPVDTAQVELRLGNLLRLRGHNASDSGDFTGVAVFGDARTEVPMPDRGLHITGQIPVLDAAAWSEVATGSSDEARVHVASVDVFAGELSLLGRRFRETRVTMQRDVAQMAIGFEGPALDGNLLIPHDGLMQKGITARFQRLHWPEMSGADLPDDALKVTNVFPAAIPPLHLESVETRFVGAQLGSVWLESWPTADGLHVERLDAHSPVLDIKAKGDWRITEQGEHSELVLDYSSRDAGAMLVALGFSRLIDGGSTHGQLRLRWPGAPAAFAWVGADGDLSVNVGQGRVLEVEPGAGRLFGLLSLTEIPRRLTLDFSDFFKSGFTFNQMAGNFRIERGNADTDEFRIDAPSAQILLSGRTGLATRDYDQTMDVLPKAGSMLPALGAIAAGPAGAAVGAVAQAVLRQPLKEMTRTTYRVTGPWAEPVIEVVERGAEP
ncbi:YhdP family protein [Xanthomonadaceae bacterium JHOS43]|nr:YhdP family protein [Xanthomonadaceae bacterium JHOS43]